MNPSKSQVTKAGKKLISSKSVNERNEALEVVNLWRTNHIYPLKLMKNSIIRLMKRHEIEPVLISQRLKRLTSIEYKLDLNKTMALAGMQDIGGYRVVVKDSKELKKLKSLIENTIEARSHKLEFFTDYVQTPKTSGYRSIHYIYTYKSKISKYDGLKLELQIRTKLQHNWATAVETAGMFTQTSLKASKGPDNWLTFFKIVSSLFAIKEKLPVLEVHTNYNMQSLMIDCYGFTKELNIIPILRGLRISARHIDVEQMNGDYFLININFVSKGATITGFKKKHYAHATDEYLRIEKGINENENAVVLVSTSSIKSLKKAYPSYFLDTSEFITALEKMNANCKLWGLIK